MNAQRGVQAAAVLRAMGGFNSREGGLWSRWLPCMLAALLLGVPSVAALIWMPTKQAWVLVAVLAVAGMLVAWGTQVSGLLRLDHPHAARFVPGHSHTLRVTALGLWLAWVVSCGLVAAVAAALLDAGWRPLLLVLMGCGAALLFTALALRWWGLWLALWLPFPLLNLSSVRAVVQPVLALAKDRWAEMPIVCTAVALLAMAVALSSVFGQGDTAHLRAYASRERLRHLGVSKAVGQKAPLSAYGRLGEWLAWPFRRTSDTWLGHITAQALPQQRSVMARAEFALHGAQHWVGHLGANVAVQVLVFGGFALVALLAGADTPTLIGGTLIGVSIGLASMVVGPMVNLPGALWRSRRERALLTLVPGMPRGDAFNQALGRRQMRHGLLIWAAALPSVLLLVWLGAGAEGLAFAGAALLLVGWTGFDVAQHQAPRSASMALAYVAMVVLGLLSLLLLRGQPAALLPWALAVLLATAGLMGWRWRRLVRPMATSPTSAPAA